MPVLSLSTRQSEVVFADEVDRKYDWMKRTGQKVGQLYGYIADGFYSTGDISAKVPTLEGYVPVPGDIKYRDLNGDNIINRYDVAAIGNTSPFINAGLQGGVEYKGVSFSFLLQGTANRDLMLGSSDYEFPADLGRWLHAGPGASSWPLDSCHGSNRYLSTPDSWFQCQQPDCFDLLAAQG